MQNEGMGMERGRGKTQWNARRSDGDDRDDKKRCRKSTKKISNKRARTRRDAPSVVTPCFPPWAQPPLLLSPSPTLHLCSIHTCAPLTARGPLLKGLKSIKCLLRSTAAATTTATTTTTAATITRTTTTVTKATQHNAKRRWRRLSMYNYIGCGIASASRKHPHKHPTSSPNPPFDFSATTPLLLTTLLCNINSCVFFPPAKNVWNSLGKVYLRLPRPLATPPVRACLLACALPCQQHKWLQECGGT